MSSIERRNVRERGRSQTPRRSASADRYVLSRSESSQAYDTRVRRSFTPLREMVNNASARYLPSYEYSSTYGYSKPVPISKTSSWRSNTNPFVITTHAIEDMPMGAGKYDVHIPGGWSYPIYRYLHKSHRPDLSYQPGGCYHPRRDYGHNIYRPSYMAGEMTYYHADINRALHNYRRWTAPSTTSNYYNYGDSSLRHFGGYRPRHVNHFIKAVWV